LRHHAGGDYPSRLGTNGSPRAGPARGESPWLGRAPAALRFGAALPSAAGLMRLADAVVVVTGGTGGLGSRLCHAFAAERWRVVAVYHSRPDAADSLVDELLSVGANAAVAVRSDVTQLAQIDELVDGVVQRWGRIDVLVNNAAFNQGVPFQ